MQAEEFDLSASFPDNEPAWSDDEDDGDGGSTSYGPSRDLIGRCRPCSSADGTGGEAVDDEFDEVHVLWDCSTKIDVTVNSTIWGSGLMLMILTTITRRALIICTASIKI